MYIFLLKLQNTLVNGNLITFLNEYVSIYYFVDFQIPFFYLKFLLLHFRL